MKGFLLDNWMLVEYEDGSCKLVGKVYGHPGFDHAGQITTSVVKELSIVNGFAITSSGSKYFLGDPDRNWIKWLESNGYVDSIKNINEMNNKKNN